MDVIACVKYMFLQKNSVFYTFQFQLQVHVAIFGPFLFII